MNFSNSSGLTSTYPEIPNIPILVIIFIPTVIWSVGWVRGYPSNFLIRKEYKISIIINGYISTVVITIIVVGRENSFYKKCGWSDQKRPS